MQTCSEKVIIKRRAVRVVCYDPQRLDQPIILLIFLTITYVAVLLEVRSNTLAQSAFAAVHENLLSCHYCYVLSGEMICRREQGSLEKSWFHHACYLLLFCLLQSESG